jgi:hypothetical protein
MLKMKVLRTLQSLNKEKKLKVSKILVYQKNNYVNH